MTFINVHETWTYDKQIIFRKVTFLESIRVKTRDFHFVSLRFVFVNVLVPVCGSLSFLVGNPCEPKNSRELHGCCFITRLILQGLSRNLSGQSALENS